MIKKNSLKGKITFLNSVTTIILQFITILSGFIIPKIILSYFGSEVNGLISSLNQFLNYIALLEGGVTGVIVAYLFKPLVDKDDKKLSEIITTTNRFYKKIGIIFILYSLLLSFFYPIIFKVSFSYVYVVTLSLILSVKLLIQYMFSLTYKTLLQADKKVYIVSITNSIIILLNIIIVYVSIKIYPQIHILKLIEGLLFILQPIIYGRYVKKHYNINFINVDNTDLLKSRWNGLAVNIAAFIHTNTDITILSLFTNLYMVSVYSVYALVTGGLRAIISAFTSGISPTIGHAYVIGDENELNKKLDIYEFINIFITYLFFSLGGLLITPFVMIYTKNIVDTNYYQPLFGILIIISEGLYVIKNHHVSLAYNANKFKEITIPCFIEAGINIIISLILVKKMQLVGVAIGTICAMIYRLVFHIWFTDKKIVKRPQRIFYFKLLSFSFATIIGLSICYFLIPKVEFTVISWLYHALIYSIIMLLLYFINSFIFYKKELIYIMEYFNCKR